MQLDNKAVPVEWLRTQFNYDPETGAITNSATRKYAVAGADPCYKIPRGSLAVKVTYKGLRYTFMAYRLAYALYTGQHPQEEIVQIDRFDRTNNRWSNLKQLSPSQDKVKRVLTTDRPLPKGVTYVARCRNRPFRAQITFKGKSRHIGSYQTVEEAVQAYNDAVRKIS